MIEFPSELYEVTIDYGPKTKSKLSELLNADVGEGSRDKILTQIVGHLANALDYNSVLDIATLVNAKFKPPLARDEVLKCVNSITSKVSEEIIFTNTNDIEVEDIRWSIEGFCEAGTTDLTYGPPKNLKSMFVLHKALCVANGVPFIGHEVNHPGPVLYFYQDGKVRSIADRARKLQKGLGLSKGVMIADKIRKKDNFIQNLERQIEKLNPKMIVIDSLYSFINMGENYGSSSDFQEQCTRMAEFYDINIEIIHHSPKADDTEILGSTFLKAAADNVTNVIKQSHDIVENTGDAVITVSRESKDHLFHPLTLHYTFSEDAYTCEHRTVTFDNGLEKKPDNDAIKSFQESLSG